VIENETYGSNLPSSPQSDIQIFYLEEIWHCLSLSNQTPGKSAGFSSVPEIAEMGGCH
jgi:alanine-alpha-ketoisovalerate/valine-pyruvate aminotransferase